MCSSRTERARPGSRRRRARAARARGWLPLALAAAAALPLGCVSGPLQTVRSNAQTTKTGADKTKSWSNLVELTEHDHLGPDLEYRVSEQFLATFDKTSVGGVDARDQTLQHRPSADLVLSQGPVRWSQRFELVDNRSLFDPGADNHLVRTDLLEKIEWSPAGMPTFTGWFENRTVEDDQFVKQSTLDSLLQVQQTSDVLDYQYTYQAQQADDLRTDVGNDRDQHTLRATWRGEFLQGALNTTVSVFADRRWNQLQGATTSTPGLQVFPLQGLSLLDLTPQISTLTANAALIDANDTVSAGINIGGFTSGGELGWNMGVRLPPGASVDTLQLVTVDEVASTFLSQFSFSVWASDDNTFWTEVTHSAVWVYDPVIRSFRLTIPAVTQTYLKLVNTSAPPAAPAVLVSELRCYTSAGVPTGSSIVSRDSTDNVTGSVSWRASDTVTLGYDVLVQQAEARSGGTLSRDEKRFDNGVWALWNPTRKVDASLRLSNQTTKDPVVQDESLDTLNSVLSYHPIETLDVSTSYTNTLRSVDGVDNVKTWVAQVLTSARLLETLRADLTLERSKQDDIANQRLVEHWVGGASLVAEVTPQIELTLGFRNDDATVTGAGASGIPDPTERRTQMIWLLRPSTQLTAQMELDWVDNFAGSGVDQRSRLDWIPFEDGAIDVQFDLDRVRNESTAHSQVDRLRAQVRYTITPRAFLELSYSVQDPSDGEQTEVVALAFNFSS